MKALQVIWRIILVISVRVRRLIGRHRVISSIVALFAAAAIAVSLATSGNAAARYPKAPGFTLAALGQSGRQVSLSQYQGKPVIINFWASWCEPCQKETPVLASWYKQQHGHVALLGLDENDSAASALKFAHAKGVTYPLGFDPNVTVGSAYGLSGLPQTFFLNAQHRVVDRIVGAATKAKLDKGLRLMDASS